MQKKHVKYISQKKYNEITDTDSLLKIGIQQMAQRSAALDNELSDCDSINVYQVLNETVYTDGTDEKQIGVSEIAVTDKNGRQLTATEIARAIGYESGNNWNESTQFSATVRCTLYATMRFDVDHPSADMVTYRCDKVVTTVVANNGSALPSSGTMTYQH